MMTDTAIQQSMDTNGQTLVTPAERQALIQKLTTKWALDLSTTVEKHAYEKSHGVKPIYFKMIQTYYQQVQNTQQIRPTLPQQTVQPINNNNNNRQFINPQINLPQQPSGSMLSHPQHQLNHMPNQQPRFPTAQPPLQPRVPNPSTAMINNQAAVLNQNVRLREPQKFNQPSLNPISYSSTPSSIQTIDLSQSYTSQPQQQLNNPNLNDYLSQPSLLQNRYSNQRQRLPTNLNANFPSQTTSNNSNDILHQFVLGNPPTNSLTVSMTNPSSSGDRLLQQILLSNNDVSSNKMPLQTRQTTPSIMPQPIRSASATNSNLNNSVNSLRSSLTSHQASPSSPVIIMPTATQTTNVQIQPSPNVTIQQSPLNNSNGLFSANSQVVAQPSSVPPNNYSSSPINRTLPSSGNGSISSPDEETINLIKFLKENVNRLQSLCQKFTNEGNLDKARNAQAIHQQMVQFINNPTYESLPTAKHTRDILERALTRSQQTNPAAVNVPIPPVSIPQINELNQFEKALTEYVSSNPKKRSIINTFIVEPLADVINNVPHKKMRLDVDNHFNGITKPEVPSSANQLSLMTKLNNELNLLPNNCFSIERLPVSHTSQTMEFNDEYLSRNGLILRCKLLNQSNPLVPPLRLRISTRYPEEQSEILSLTKTMPPKLEFSDGHPFFEQLSTIFVSYLFKLPSQHTVTDILNIWYQSVQSAL